MRSKIETFIRNTYDIQDTDVLIRHFRDFIADYGFSLSSYHYIANEFHEIPFEKGARSIVFPEDWIDHYENSAYFDIDPIIKLSRAVGRPFRWYEATDFAKLTPRQHELLDDLRSAGFKDGYAVPVFGRPGDIAYFGIGSVEKANLLNDTQLLEMQLVCEHVHKRFNEIEMKRDEIALSNRESQVLNHLVKGKSNAAIADALGVSVHTIDTIVRRCFAKLGVSNRVEAALVAVSRGLALA